MALALSQSLKFTSAGSHDVRRVFLQRVSDHVLDEVPVPWCLDEGVVPFVREELLALAVVDLPFVGTMM